MTYELRTWIKSEIENNGWEAWTEFSDQPFNGETVEIMALDMDSRLHKGLATYDMERHSFKGQTIFKDSYSVSRVMAWRRTALSLVTPNDVYMCKRCKFGPEHSNQRRKCSSCRFNRNLKDNHEWIEE